MDFCTGVPVTHHLLTADSLRAISAVCKIKFMNTFIRKAGHHRLKRLTCVSC